MTRIFFFYSLIYYKYFDIKKALEMYCTDPQKLDFLNELNLFDFLKLSNLDISKDEVLKVFNIFKSKGLLKFLFENDI